MTEDPIIVAAVFACIAALALMASAVINRKRRKPEKQWEFDKDGVPF